MSLLKRKRSGNNSGNFSDADSGDEVDISSALTGKKFKKGLYEDLDELPSGEDEDDDGLAEVIERSIVKRNVKSGTELLKKTKGKSKIVKGEVGGGSFQSMGTPGSVHTTEFYSRL